MPANATFARRVDRQRKHHCFYLWLAAVVVTMAFLLTVRSDQRVALRPLPQIVLPESCQSKVWFGVDCPGCGLTRSFVYLAAGNPAASFHSHRVGWLMALAILGQFPYRWFALRRLLRFAPALSAGSGEVSSSGVMEPDAIDVQEDDAQQDDDHGDDARSSEESLILFSTPVWVEAFAKLLLVGLLGNWVLKVLGY